MKIELEESDVLAIAQKVVEMVKPYLVTKGKRDQDDTIFDVPALCEYLMVTPKWVYEQTHLKAIPHTKLGNKQLRFRKRAIDQWVDAHSTPAGDITKSC